MNITTTKTAILLAVSLCLLPVSGSVDYRNVRDFGAVGNGVTDDADAILKAIAAAAKGSPVIYFPAGTYLVKKPIIFDGQKCFIGEPAASGTGGASILKAGASIDAILSGYPAASFSNIQNLTFDGSADKGFTIDYAVKMENHNSRIANVKIFNISGGGLLWGVPIDGTPPRDVFDWINWFENIDITVTGNNYAMHNHSSDSYYQNVRVSGGQGMHLYIYGGVVLCNIIAENSNTAGLTIHSRSFSIVNSVFRNNATYGLHLTNTPTVCGNILLADSHLYGNKIADVCLAGCNSIETFCNNDMRSAKNMEYQGTYPCVSYVNNRFAGPYFSGVDTLQAGNRFKVPTTAKTMSGLVKLIPDRTYRRVFEAAVVRGSTPHINVKEYGAIGNGTADDSRAIQNAISDVAPGGTVFIPSGKYRLGSTLVLKDNINLVGSARNTYLIASTGSEPLMKTARPTSDVHIMFIRFDHDSGFTGATLLKFYDLSNSIMDMCYVRSKIDGGTTVHLGPGSRNFIFNNGIINSQKLADNITAGTGIKFEGADCIVKGTYLSSNGIGACFHSTRRNTLINCMVDHSVHSAVKIDGSGGAYGDVVVKNCWIDATSTGKLINYDYPDNATAHGTVEILSNMVSVSNHKGGTETPYPVFYAIRNGRNLLLQGNTTETSRCFFITGKTDSCLWLGNCLKETPYIASGSAGASSVFLGNCPLDSTVPKPPATFRILSSTDSGGAVVPWGARTFIAGQSREYSFTPHPGYSVSSVKVDGVSIGAVSGYTFKTIKADHTIDVTFIPATSVIPGGVSGKTADGFRISCRGGRIVVYQKGDYLLSIISASGRTVKSIRGKDATVVTLEGKFHGAGVYFAVVSSGGGVKAQKFIAE